MRKMTGLLLVLLMCSGASSAAQPGNSTTKKEAKLQENDKMSGRVQNIVRYLAHQEELFLSNEQIKKLQEIQSQFELESNTRLRDIQTARKELDEMYELDNADLIAIKEKVRTVSDKELAYRLYKYDAYERAYNMLNPDQRAKMAEIKKGKNRKRNK